MGDVKIVAFKPHPNAEQIFESIMELCRAVSNGEDKLDELYHKIHMAQGCEGCRTKCEALRRLEVCSGQRTPEWHAKRKTMVTASEAASVLRQNPYETPDQVLQWPIRHHSI